MNIWEADKLQLFIMFVIPGFISIKTYELLYPSQLKDSSKQLIDAITYSCVNYSILYWVIKAVEANGFEKVHPNLYIVFYIFVLLISPVILVFIWKLLRESERFKKNLHHPTQKPWDYFFAQQKCYWVKITLKDGSLIAGYYGAKSFASSSPAEEQIYLESKWILNDAGAFDRKVNSTAGVIVLTSEIAHIEFRN